VIRITSTRTTIEDKDCDPIKIYSEKVTVEIRVFGIKVYSISEEYGTTAPEKQSKEKKIGFK